MIAFVKLIGAFAPWLSFLLIAQSTMFRVKVGLALALSLSVAMGIARLHRGIILWIGLVFFSYAMVAIVAFEDHWTLQHMGILANGVLAAGSWLTVIVKRPFTLDYARSTPTTRCGTTRFSKRQTMLLRQYGRRCSRLTLAWHF